MKYLCAGPLSGPFVLENYGAGACEDFVAVRFRERAGPSKDDGIWQRKELEAHDARTRQSCSRMKVGHRNITWPCCPARCGDHREIECPFDRLNPRQHERRPPLFGSDIDEGNGRTTRSPLSQITKRLFVFRRIPFRQRLANRFQIAIGGARLANFDDFAAPRLKAFPDFPHRSDRFDGGGRPAVFSGLGFFPRPTMPSLQDRWLPRRED